MRAVVALILILSACAQVTGVQNKDHRTLASCAGTFRAIEQVTTTAQVEFSETSQFVQQATVFRDALSTARQSLPQTEQNSLVALEDRAFEQGLMTWEGVTARTADDLTVFNRLEYKRIERRCLMVLNR